MRRFLPFLLVLGLLVSVGSARAWTMEEGVEIFQDPTTIVLGQDVEVTTDVYFVGETFYIAPFGFEFNFASPHTWTLENWSAPLNVTFVGNATEDGSISFVNFQGIYQVTGLQGYPSFLIPGPSFELVIPTGTTNFTVRLASLSGASPINLHMSAAWSPANDTVFAVATLLDNFGNTWSALGVTSTLLRPDGSVHSTINMTETVVSGVYNANHAVAPTETNGTWTVTANFGTTAASYAVIKQGAPLTEDSPLEITLGLGNYLPILLFGGLVIWFMWTEALFVAVVCFLAFGNALLGAYSAAGEFMPISGSFMLVGIALMIHLILAKLPDSWRLAINGRGEK